MVGSWSAIAPQKVFIAGILGLISKTKAGLVWL